jgi:hypothetical protein
MRVTVALAEEMEVKVPSEDATAVVHLGMQCLDVVGEIEATITLKPHLEHEVDAEQISLPDSVIRTCTDLELGHISTLQELFDVLEEMEKDMHFQEGTQCKK